jgi:choline dehydrogenase-like flavoprotein
MRPVDARSLESGRVLEADLCIVGAGAAGITLANALADSGQDILLVESGDRAPDAAIQALHDVTSVGYPLRQSYINRARQYGGSCNLWAGRSIRLWRQDVDGHGWPIPFSAIVDRYAAAAAILGLPEADLLTPEAWTPRLSPTEAAIYAGGGIVPVVSLWARKPMRFAEVHGPALERAGSVRVLLHANATGLDSTDGRSVAAVRLATLDGRKLEVRAGRYVLAAGGLENARLLLLAPGLGQGREHIGRCFMDHPRTVFGKAVLNGGARLPLMGGWPLRHGKVQLGMALSPERQRQEGLLNHYCTFESEVSGYAAQQYQASVEVAKVLLRKGHAGSRLDFGSMGKGRVEGLIYQLSPKEILPHWAFRTLTLAKAALRPPKGPQRFVLVTFCEQPPDPESRCRLGAERDALGLPRLTVDWRIGDDVRRSLSRLHELLGEQLVRTGLGRVEPGEAAEPTFTDASHHMGTTRMSDGPDSGVVDAEGRMHGVDNLWIAGSSIFPTAGHANPTLTIVALTLRLAERLRQLRA